MSNEALTAEGTPRKIAPRGKGTVEYDEEEKRYMGGISLADGSRPWVKCKPSPKSKQAEFSAREDIGHEAEKARRAGLTGADFGSRGSARRPPRRRRPLPERR